MNKLETFINCTVSGRPSWGSCLRIVKKHAPPSTPAFMHPHFIPGRTRLRCQQQKASVLPLKLSVCSQTLINSLNFALTFAGIISFYFFFPSMFLSRVLRWRLLVSVNPPILPALQNFEHGKHVQGSEMSTGYKKILPSKLKS